MKLTGKLKRIELPFRSKIPSITLDVRADPADLEDLLDKDLDISLAKHRNRRSLDANAMLWACLGKMAAVLRTDNWSMYLHELERYGKFAHILVSPDMIEAVKRQWRETKVVGETQVVDQETGEIKPMVQMICFFGSSTYNTAEFSRLLDGVIGDMRDMRLEIPPSEDVKRVMEEHDKARRQQKAR
jgi:hypothetical protein